MNDASHPDNGETPEKDVPLRYDTRLLGRILGDTVRSQEGEPVLDLVERIRRTGVQFHRNADEDARRELQSIMSSLPTGEAIRIIRAFGYFSHLANLAEDQHHIRRTHAHALTASAPREGTMARALARAREAGIPPARLRTFFASAMVVPVLTAHPTEVRRKSMIDREIEVADTSGRTRPPAADRDRTGRKRGGAASRGPDLMADKSAAPNPPSRDRRGG